MTDTKDLNIPNIKDAIRMWESREKFQKDNPIFGIKLSPKQREFFDTMIAPELRVDRLPRGLFAVGANKGGKTMIGVLRGIGLAIGEHPFLPDDHPLRYLKHWKLPTVGLVIGEQLTQSVDKKLVPEYLKWIPKICKPITKKNQQGIIVKITIQYDLHGNRLDSIIHFRCYSDDTEVLTDDGWKLFKDLNKQECVMTMNLETRELEWQHPTAYHENYYHGNMIKSNHAYLDFMVTPNHKMVYQSAHSKPYKEKPHKLIDVTKLNRRYAVPRHFKWTGKEIEYFDIPISSRNFKDIPRKRKCSTVFIKIKAMDWVAFLGIYLAEGSVTGSGGQIEITQSDGWKKNKIRDMLSKLSIKYSEFSYGFRIFDTVLASFMSQFGKAIDKFIPNNIKDSSSELIYELLKWLFLGDGCLRNGHSKKMSTLDRVSWREKSWENLSEYENYTTASKSLADDVQELLMKVGLNGAIYHHSGGWHTVTINKSRQIGYLPGKQVKDRSYVEEVSYDGSVYCVSVPNKTVMTRRNGRTLISGNSYDSKPDTMEGIDMNFIHWDEPPPYTHYVAAERGLVPTDGISFMTFTSLKQPWIKDLADESVDYGGPKEDVRVVELGDIWGNCVENGGVLTRAAIESFIAKVPEEERPARIEGKWLFSGSIIYSSFRNESPWVIPNQELPAHWTRIEAIDPHDSRATRWLFCSISPQEIMVDDEMLFRIFVEDYINLPSSYTIQDMVKEVKRKRIDLGYGQRSLYGVILDAKFGSARTVTMDGAEPINWQNKLEGAGSGYIILSHSNPGDVELGHKLVRAYLIPQFHKPIEKEVPGLVFMERCQGPDSPIEAMLKYRYKIGTDKPDESFKDWMDCARYVCLERPTYIERYGRQGGDGNFTPRDKHAGR